MKIGFKLCRANLFQYKCLQINLRRLQSVCYLHQHLCHLIWLRGCLFLSSGVNFPVLREKVKIMATFVPCPREMMTVKSSWGFFIRL